MELPEFLTKLGVTKDTDPNDPSTWSDSLITHHQNHLYKLATTSPYNVDEAKKSDGNTDIDKAKQIIQSRFENIDPKFKGLLLNKISNYSKENSSTDLSPLTLVKKRYISGGFGKKESGPNTFNYKSDGISVSIKKWVDGLTSIDVHHPREGNPKAIDTYHNSFYGLLDDKEDMARLQSHAQRMVNMVKSTNGRIRSRTFDNYDPKPGDTLHYIVNSGNNDVLRSVTLGTNDSIPNTYYWKSNYNYVPSTHGYLMHSTENGEQLIATHQDVFKDKTTAEQELARRNNEKELTLQKMMVRNITGNLY